ncbi:MAG: methylmalonyl Co-A mutase-associated GTPase MeaB [Bacteroidota bacterium]
MSSRLNPNLRQLSRFNQLLSAKQYVEKIRAGNRVALGQAITLIESTASVHQKLAQEIVELCLPFSGNSKRIGITGSPGVGKSTFIEAIGQYIIENEQQKVAVLAIDPSSQVHRGSILGDKTRMEKLSRLENAFIRPSPAGETLGGVARKTRESIILCEAANYETILIETVGVGQSEIAVHSMVDCFLLLLLPGAGDELQGIKRGIVEMADFVIINKAEEERRALAKSTKKSYRNALHLFPIKDSDWTSAIHAISALQQIGLEKLWKDIERYFQHVIANNYLEQHRNEQATYWLHESIESGLKNWFYNDRLIQEKLQLLEQYVANKSVSPFKAAADLLKNKLKHEE